jgi:hypothetical protein
MQAGGSLMAASRGRTDGSIRPRVTTILKFPLAQKGASTDGARIGESMRWARISSTKRCSAGAEAVDYAHVLLRYPRLRVILHAGMLVPGETPRFTLHGTLGSYVKHGLDPQEDALKRGERPGGRGWGADPRDGVLTTWRDGAPHARTVPTEAGDHRAYYAGLRDAILRRGRVRSRRSRRLWSWPSWTEQKAVLDRAEESAVAGRELPFEETV